MAKEFNLKITTCDRSFYSGPCESIVLPAIDGEHGVLADHEPMVTAIVSGECRFTANGKQNIIAVGQGFAEIKPEQWKLLLILQNTQKKLMQGVLRRLRLEPRKLCVRNRVFWNTIIHRLPCQEL